MASTINADNGVISGSSGVKTTADTSGVLALQSNGTTALSVGTDLSVTLTNPLPVASGGTNSTATPTAGGVGYGTGTAHAYTSAGTSGQVLTSAGSGAPTWAAVNTGNFGTDITATDYTLTTSTALNAASASFAMQAVSLDGTSELMILNGSSSAHAVIWNSSTNTFGTPVLVRTATLTARSTIALVKISSTSVLVCSLPSSDTALQTVVLTISGSTITVGTPVSTTLAAVSDLVVPNTRLVAVGSSYVLNYFTSGDGLPKFRAITVSGTTPTVGSEFAYAGGTISSQHHSYAYSSSILLHFSLTDAAFVYVYPISVSGTTLTGGTQATVAVTSGAGTMVTGALSNSRYALLYRAAGGGTGAVVSVSGTIASISSAATTLTVSTWSPQMQVFSNQAFILSGSAGADQISVLTDTAGSASVGTPLTVANNGNFAGYLSTGKIFLASSISGQSNYYQYGISSGAAVLEKAFQNITSTSVITTQVLTASTYARPLSGPPQSSSNQSIILRTSSGKIAAGTSGLLPFVVSVDGTYPAKLQQTANPFTAYNDAISDAVNWGIPATTSGTATSIIMRKVTLV